MKSRYINIQADSVMSNNHLEEICKDYKLITAFAGYGSVTYVFKKRNFFSRLINKIFNF